MQCFDHVLHQKISLFDMLVCVHAHIYAFMLAVLFMFASFCSNELFLVRPLQNNFIQFGYFNAIQTSINSDQFDSSSWNSQLGIWQSLTIVINATQWSVFRNGVIL